MAEDNSVMGKLGAVDGFNNVLGTEFVDITADRVELSCVVKPHLHQPYGIVHGGVYCSLVETAASVAAAMWLGDKGNVVGVANHTNFIRATKSDTVTAESPGASPKSGIDSPTRPGGRPRVG